MIHFPGVNPKGSANPSPGTVRKDGVGLWGNMTSLLWYDPTEQQNIDISVMLHTQTEEHKTQMKRRTSAFGDTHITQQLLHKKLVSYLIY